MSEVHDEFLAEAQEIIEGLSRDLLLLDQAQKEGRPEPELVNEVFRGVHTLKGIAGMFGYPELGGIAHALEDLLDDLRLGRIPLSQDVLDVLFEGVENFQRMLVDGASMVDQQAFSELIQQVSRGKAAANPTTVDAYDLDPNVLSVLTEYEEHRLRSNLEQGTALYRLEVRFSLMSIDTSLEQLKIRAKPLGEIITYLPSMGGGDGETIELDVLLASELPFERLQDELAVDGAILVPVPRKRGLTERPPAPATPPPKAASIVPVSYGQTEAGLPAIVEEEVEPREAAADLSLRSLSNSVRVDIRKLDHLMNVVGELAIVRSAVSRITDRIRSRADLRHLAIELHRVNRGFERQLGELQDGILDVRMVPLGQVFDKLARIVRQVAREHEKEVRFVVSGAETEVDKLIVEELSDPLMHIIRNAIDHGIEAPKVRGLAEKPSEGTLALNAYQKGNHVVIEVEDDGAGMNPQMLIETAVRKGLVPKDSADELTREEVLNLVFMPGFSTRSSITDLSGRGVGMDVVKTNISRLGGVVEVQSELGSGTKMTITLPVTLAIINALLISVGTRRFAIPITSVQEAILFDPAAVRTIEGREVLNLRGATLPLCHLDALFGLSREPSEKRYVVVSEVGNRRVGFVVDSLAGQQDIVIKALGKSLQRVRGFAGATDLGDQQVALVLDAPGLLEEVLRAPELTLAESYR